MLLLVPTLQSLLYRQWHVISHQPRKHHLNLNPSVMMSHRFLFKMAAMASQIQAAGLVMQMQFYFC